VFVRRFLRDSGVYALGGLVTRGLNLLLLPFYTRVLSSHDYGLVDLLIVLGAFVNVTLALEVSQGLARLLPDADDRSERARLASTALWFTVAVYIVFTVICWALAPQLAAVLLDSPESRALLRVGLVSIALHGVFNLLQSQLRFELRPLQHSISSLVAASVTIVATVALVLLLHLEAVGVIYGQLLGYGCGAAIAFYLARGSLRAELDLSVLKRMLGFSLPFVPSSVGVILALYVDRLVIKELLTITEVGIYGVAYRFASAAGLLMLGFQGALTPLIYNHYQEPDTPAELARVFRLFVAFALALLLTLGLFASEIVVLFTSPEYYRASSLIPLLIPSVLLSGMYIFAPGLSIAKRGGAIALINLSVAAVNLLLNLALVPLFGTHGAALATLISALLGFGLYITLSQRYYLVPHRWHQLLAATIPVAGLLLLGITLERLAPSYALIFASKLLLLSSALPFIAWVLVRNTFGDLQGNVLPHTVGHGKD
jgi:O-antigen/teichoic acid export membrane protein